MAGIEEGKLLSSYRYWFVLLLYFVSEQHHVKFIEETGTFGKENTINIQKLSQWNLQAHLGFLKLNHSYEICLSLDNPMTKDNSRWLANVISSFFLFLFT